MNNIHSREAECYMKNKEKPIINPYITLIIGVSAVSTSAIFVKLATAPAPIIATYRLLFTFLLMTPIFLLFYRHELKDIKKKDWIFSTLSGVFLAFHFILWFESLNYTSVASSVVLVTLQPLFSVIGAYFLFKERVPMKAILGGSLAIAGSFFIGWGDFKIGGMALFGDILALLGAIMVTAYWLCGQDIRKRLSLITYTYVVYGASSLTLVIYNLALGYSFFPYPTMDWVYFLSLALFPTLLGHTLFNWAIRWLNASTISMSILGEPIGSAILAYFILGEVINTTQYIGGALILFGIYAFIKWNEQTKTNPSFENCRDSHPANSNF
ncbi:DMT family transporter [Microaerobacter geothermalis]|uniref:DMT family transporter n=1 Tax=Microaerobacter geothermalis TaxID=674972 RepID=UPI001F294219|nr:DMT family transporter [Microaerobacter geothermalis]MCF6092965.1 DMT family transporter [Microaerobacter geothermalis]